MTDAQSSVGLALGVRADENPGTSHADPIELLVVDDEKDVEVLFRLRFRKELRDHQLNLRFECDPRAALALIQQDEDIDVLVTDLNMPDMHGLELIEQVSRLRHSLKIIVLTAYGDLANIRAAMMQGAFDFQVKPLEVEDLRATIKRAAELVRTLRAGREAARKAQELDRHSRFVEEVFGRYVSADVRTHLLSSPEGFRKSERRVLTAMSADVRGFTALADLVTPEQALAALNGYLETASDVIFRHNGTINEIMGDGLLVFFGAPVPDERSAEHAVAAAIELQLAMSELNAASRSRGLPELTIGVGVHTGEALVGTIGSRHRQKYTAIGRTINLVSRIEAQTYGGQILVSEATRQAAGDTLRTGARQELQLKGLAQPVSVYEVTGLGGVNGLRLPPPADELADLVPARTVHIALISNARVGEEQEVELLATSARAFRIRSAAGLSPGDEIRLRDSGTERTAKISYAHEGHSPEYVAVYTSVLRSADRVRLPD
jgi:class 3 adenylate cyclase